MTMRKRLGVALILLFAFAGLADSAYLAQHEASGTPLLCNIANLSGCNVVAQSPYSRVFGVPLAEFGVLFYAIVFTLAALELVVFDRLLRRVLQALALAGVLASAYFTLLQVFVVHALCVYCLASALATLLILACASFIEPVRRTAFSPIPRPPEPPSPPPFSMPPSA